MKKTIIAIALLAGVANADVTLRYLIDFSASNGTVANAANSENQGSTTISSIGYVNWGTPGSTMDGSAYAHPASSTNWKISSTNGINDGSLSGVLNTADGFTVMFNGYAPATGTDWKDFLSITIGSTSYKFEITDSTSLDVYNNTQQSTPEASLSGISRETWYNFGISVLGSTYTVAAIDASGSLVSSTTYTGATGNLTHIQDISSFEAHTSVAYFTDNIAVYDGAISTADMIAITKNQVAGKGTLNTIAVASVPEPTTATLSLLALAGLAARRRRK